MTYKIKILLFSICLVCTSIAQGATNPTVEAFIDRLVEQHGLDKENIEQILKQAVNQEELIRSKFQGSAEMNWTWGRYRKNFLSKSRTENGYRFWQENKALFAQAEKEFSVPQHILAAIVGVETNYGKRPGKIRVLDSLYTQAFHMPESDYRTRFGRAELEAFLVLAIEEKIDPLEAKGSYAGAMGLPQFIPTSYLNYSVDFDKDGRRDLWNSLSDVVGSVANYFHQHNWKMGEAVTTPVVGVKPEHSDWITGENVRPKPPALTIGQLRESGIQPKNKALSDEQTSSLMEFTTEAGKEYWAGLENFYVITRYNRSNLYAMAVYQLSQEILALGEKEARKMANAKR